MRYTLPATVIAFLVCHVSGKFLSSSVATDVVQIQQTLNLFPLSVDRKNYSLLAEIFTADATANFLVGPITHGLEEIQEQLQARLKGLISHHSLTTQSIEVEQGRKTASATSYLIAVFFGHGPLAKQIFTNYGQYLDTLVLDQQAGGWRVKNRTLVLTVRFPMILLAISILDVFKSDPHYSTRAQLGILISLPLIRRQAEPLRRRS